MNSDLMKQLGPLGYRTSRKLVPTETISPLSVSHISLAVDELLP